MLEESFLDVGVPGFDEGMTERAGSVALADAGHAGDADEMRLAGGLVYHRQRPARFIDAGFRT